jgi:hypothetical protein
MSVKECKIEYKTKIYLIRHILGFSTIAILVISTKILCDTWLGGLWILAAQVASYLFGCWHVFVETLKEEELLGGK